ncbi:hydroxylamine reductase Hcp [Thermoclostridium stercorarium subsp. stercorarium DSM 8532]|uniref:Hydroxylamine reductase n=2 Tax=Thermoclostridium stercorarium TaxID=1510 RepID=L7VNM5_THES1|nr:hydroxylamine reductase [Thermoclostridium stercorarium]AGC68066.1 hydroxylamine reductase Hcp [Thermoclostridium stercorarium subsp. stercorarium DSM 8532]AGI39094.1 hydroxylamine reductase [Thermoclostridium stercorarium subsp. stercorarium DSM 8532]ANW98454.1 hydroxylamine reductase [Thermoclostridium stercorarium subsp. thermolacticum DSM 2910]
MSMFCFQCEQTAGGKGCVKTGVCGKKPEVAIAQDKLTCALIGLARAAGGKSPGRDTAVLMIKSLFATVTNVNFDEKRINELIEEVEKEKNRLGGAENFNMRDLWNGNVDIVSFRSTLLLGIRGMAAYAYHAHVLGKENEEVMNWFFKGMKTIGEDHTVEEWLDLLMEFGNINLQCMALLDEANTSAYGHPVPTKVTTNVEKGPFIVVSGHDLHDLKQLLEQTEGKGINIYTHGEMLPAHAYPELKKYPHLKGNFGTAWQNQQKEFDGIPGAFLFTTNCLMPPKASYADRVFTTSVVGYPGLRHIPEGENGVKDFTPVIEKAIELGGYPEDMHFTGINGGSVLTTGFARNTVLSVADKVIDAVKSGAIRHFFLVGGCDGAKPGRNYYTEFVKKAPKDTIILTLACGKYRFNDLDLGTIGGLPRIMDMGQCNDAYSAIQVALDLAKAFDCTVNELPLTLVLSWYEQKAVCILLTLLALGIKNIYLGPSLPAFLSSNVLGVLVDKFGIRPITTPEEDLKAILG